MWSFYLFIDVFYQGRLEAQLIGVRSAATAQQAAQEARQIIREAHAVEDIRILAVPFRWGPVRDHDIRVECDHVPVGGMFSVN